MDRFTRKPIRLPPTAGETRRLCGCGLSRSFPFCDGTQMIAKTNVRGELVPCGDAKQPVRAEPELQAS